MPEKNWKEMATKETQYQEQVELYNTEGPVTLGLTTGHTWHNDPKRLVFLLARYKFVARMLTGYKRVLEVGCGDGFGARLVAQAGCDVTCTDFDPVFISEGKAREANTKGVTFELADFLKGPFPKEKFEAAYLLDVIEHIPPENEDAFIRNICSTLEKDGICIFGAPSLESQTYASDWSRRGHVNCRSGEVMRESMKKYFKHVFMFSMNDEIVHTGYLPMAHYLFAVCVGPR